MPTEKKNAAKKKAAATKTPPAPKTTDTLPARNADNSLQDLFLGGLKDMYWAEKHLLTALPKMADAASTNALAEAFTEHLEITKTHVERLEEIFSQLGEDPLPKKCPALEGLVIGGENMINETAPESEARETGILQSGLKVENFEITAYLGLIELANKLNLPDAADLLGQTLSEEENAADILSELGKTL